MNLKEAVKLRHSVRQYEEKELGEDIVTKLECFITEVNTESGLHIQLVKNEPRAFSGTLAHYGNFSGVTNYVAIVLYAQTLGLNTCWVAMTYSKVPSAFKIGQGEKIVIVICIGYGIDQGQERKSKKPEDVSNIDKDSPDWFKEGIDAALLAPTALNQQKFKLLLLDDKVKAKAGLGFNTKVDLGIVKYNFEVGSDKGHDIWS